MRTCPSCNSLKIWKAGNHKLTTGFKQRYQCQDCRKRFSEPTKIVNKTYVDRNKHQIGRYEKRKNLVESLQFKDGSSWETTNSLFNYTWYLKKQGYAETTVLEWTRVLKRLQKLAGTLSDPEAIKLVIAENKRWCANTKIIMVNTYTSYLKSIGETWNPPHYREVQKIPFIPTEKEIDLLISSCGRITATFLQLLKETAARSSEAISLEWKDIDVERRIIRITPKKGSNPRIFRVSTKLVGMLNNLEKKSKLLFRSNLVSMRTTFSNTRRRTAGKLQNPKLLNISFHTLRHWKATMEYHRTKDILHVMNLLGHRNVQITMRYIQLEKTLFSEDSDEFICRVAKDQDEAKALVEVGFDYICTTPERQMLFRKRK